jgi:hypothetical protein
LGVEMPERLDAAFLRRECSEEVSEGESIRAMRIAHALGPLAERWLAGPSRQLAGFASTPEQLPATVKPGAFHALVVLRESFPVLRPAFALPLRWGRDREHSAKLPATLLEHADRVVELHRDIFPQRRHTQWGLSTDFPNARNFDLSGLDIDGQSASAAMLAALELAEANIGAIGTVLASIACIGDTWSRVEGVGMKLDAAFDIGAKCVFLADGNEADGEAWQRSKGLSGFVRYIRAESGLLESLGQFLKELEAPPPRTATLADHAAYYERAMVGKARGDARRDYYLTVLIDPLAKRCHSDPGVQIIRGPVDCLIGCVAPGQSPTVALLARLLRPQRVFLLHSAIAEDRDGQLQNDLGSLEMHLRADSGVGAVHRMEIDLVKLSLEQLRAKVSHALDAAGLAGQRGEAAVVVDLTNGPKRLSLALLSSAPPAATCLLVDSQPTSSGVHRIGSERIEAIGLQPMV